MALIQPPPTVALPTIGEGLTEAYNPIWVKWFIDLVDQINASVGGSSTTTAVDVFGKREQPGVGIFQPDMQQILANQIFGG